MAKKIREINSIERQELRKALQTVPVPFFNFKSIYATGGDAALSVLVKSIGKLQSKINLIYYGDKTNKRKGIKFPFKKEKINGILPLMVELNSIDFCNLINYILNNIPLDENSGSFRTVNLLKDISKKTINLIDEVLYFTPNPNNIITIGDIIVLNEDIPEIPTINERGEITTYSADINDKITVDANNIEVLKRYPTSYSKTNNKAKEVLIKLRNAVQEISSITNDPDLVDLIPQLTQGNNFITDFLRKLDRSISLEQIPNEDLQKILRRIRDLRNILSLIVGIQSFRDALGAIQTATGLNIDREIQRIQKSLDFSVLIRIIRTINIPLQIINQIAQKLLKIIKIISIYVKIQIVVLKVLRKILKLFNKLPLPLKFLLYGKLARIERTKDQILAEIDRRLEILRGYNTLVELVSATIIDITIKLQFINKQLQILENNLQLCSSTDESPILTEISTLRSKIVKSIEELEVFTDRFNPEVNPNVNIFGGFTLEIQEEELVDEGIRNKRRRGIALDANGLLAEQTDLTFATDTNIILEELKLKLINRGLVSPVSNTQTGFPDLDILIEDISLDEDIPEIEDEDEELDNEYKDIQTDLDTALNSIKGVSNLRRRIRNKITGQVSKLNQDIKQDNTEGITLPGSTITTLNNVPKVIDTGSTSNTTNKDILSDEERRNLETRLRGTKALRADLQKRLSSSSMPNPLLAVSNNSTMKKYNDRIKQIEDKLAADNKARQGQ